MAFDAKDMQITLRNYLDEMIKQRIGAWWAAHESEVRSQVEAKLTKALTVQRVAELLMESFRGFD